MNSNLLAIKPRWSAVAAVVSERLGKSYGGDYVQQVSAGTRNNAKVEEVLRELGAMRDQLSQLTATAAPRTSRLKRASQVAA